MRDVSGCMRVGVRVHACVCVLEICRLELTFGHGIPLSWLIVRLSCIGPGDNLTVTIPLPLPSFDFSSLLCPPSFPPCPSSPVPARSSLVLANVHVLFNPKRGDIKLAQLHHLLLACHSLSRKHHAAPIIVCGDFNATPNVSPWAEADCAACHAVGLRIIALRRPTKHGLL